MKIIKPAILIFTILTVITGLIYPLIITGITQNFFAEQANGSMYVKNGQIIGSKLIGQSFSSAQYFWGRPSATTPMANNAEASSGANLGPTNPALFEALKTRINILQKSSQTISQTKIPVDLITSSASGLDPDISPAAAYYQIPRIAKIRHLNETKVYKLVQKQIQDKQWGFLGEARVNVLELNIALDQLTHNNVNY